MCKRPVLAVGSALLFLTLAACGSPTSVADRRSTSTSASTSVPSTLPPSSTTTAPAAPPPCDGAAVAAVVARWNRYASVTSFGCAGEFAYALVAVTGPPPFTGGKGTVLLTGSAGQWQIVNRATYCADGSVPPAISQPACQGT